MVVYRRALSLTRRSRPLTVRLGRGKSALAGRIGIRRRLRRGLAQPAAGRLSRRAWPSLPGGHISLWDSRPMAGCARPVRPKGHTRRLRMPHGLWGMRASTRPAKRPGVRHVASPQRTVRSAPSSPCSERHSRRYWGFASLVTCGRMRPHHAEYGVASDPSTPGIAFDRDLPVL